MKRSLKKYGIYIASSLILSFFVFSTAFAQGPSANANDVISRIITLLKDYVIKLIFALAIVYFMWGVVQYVLYPDNEDKKDKAKNIIITGIFAIAAMFSVYGLVRIALNTFGVNEKEVISTPKLPGEQ